MTICHQLESGHFTAWQHRGCSTFCRLPGINRELGRIGIWQLGGFWITLTTATLRHPCCLICWAAYLCFLCPTIGSFWKKKFRFCAFATLSSLWVKRIRATVWCFSKFRLYCTIEIEVCGCCNTVWPLDYIDTNEWVPSL